MSKMGFVRLEELAKTCKCLTDDLLLEAASDNLKLSIPFFGEERQNFHFRTPLALGNQEPVVPDPPETGVFDLHLEDIRELVNSKSAVVEDIFSPCGKWVLTLTPSRLLHISDVVVRIEEAQSFEIGLDLTPQVTDTERSRLLRQIAGMALLIAAENKVYRVGERPSADAIADAVAPLFNALTNANLKGLGDTNIRTSIKKGLKLLGVA